MLCLRTCCLVCMDGVASVSSCFTRNKKVGRKVLAVLECMFHGSCRKVSWVLSLALEPTSKSMVHVLAKVVSSKVVTASKPKYRS